MYFTSLMKYLFVLIPILFSALTFPGNSISQDSVRFAVIGDYGNAGPDELAVANLVNSFSNSGFTINNE